MFHLASPMIILMVSTVYGSYVPTSSSCPEGWSVNQARTKCYHYDPQFRVYGWGDQVAYCNNIGGRVIEPANMQELKEVELLATDKDMSWTEGTWVNWAYINKKVVSATTLRPPADAALLKYLENNFNDTGNPDKPCTGYNPMGAFFFDPCNVTANPFCERNIR